MKNSRLYPVLFDIFKSSKFTHNPDIYPNPWDCGQVAVQSTFPCKPLGFYTNRDRPLILAILLFLLLTSPLYFLPFILSHICSKVRSCRLYRHSI